MKNKGMILLIICCLGLLSWGSAQSTQTAPFDLKKSQQELEIMKGILSTTLSFVTREIKGRDTTAPVVNGMTTGIPLGSTWGFSNINAFYLYGQGAVFTVPLSGLKFASGRSGRLIAMGGEDKFYFPREYAVLADSMRAANDGMEAASAALEQQAEELAAVSEAMADVESTRSSGVATLAVPASPAQAPVAPKAITPRPGQSAPLKAQTKEKQEDLQKRLADAQEKVKKRREELEEQQKKFMATLGEVKGYLIEALANHGDTLTHVKPNEYVNLILTSDEFNGLGFNGAGTRAQREIVSIQKSVITDYKSGRINLDQLKQKALQYLN